jgi:Na+/phosphate symporter
LPFTGVLAWIATKLAPGQARELSRRSQPRFIQAIYLDTPVLALDQTRRELARFGRHLDRLLARDLFDVSASGSGGERAQLESEAHDLRRLYRAIIDYLRVLSSGEMTSAMSEEHERMLHVATHLQNVVDTVATQLSETHALVVRGGYQPLLPVHGALEELQQRVRDELRDAVRAFDRRDPELAQRIESHKSEVRAQCDAALERITARLRTAARRASKPSDMNRSPSRCSIASTTLPRGSRRARARANRPSQVLSLFSRNTPFSHPGACSCDDPQLL